jgi:hypothetical protein
VNYEEAVVYSFWPWRILTLFAPDFFGDPMRGTYWGYTNFWESHAYQGTFPFWMALATLFLLLRDAVQKRINPRKGLVIFLWIGMGITFVLALGQFTPVFPFLYRHVPTFAMFQAPARYLILATFAAPVLAAVGIERLPGISEKVLFWVRLGCAAAVALAIGAGFAALAVHGVKMTFLPATVLTGLWLFGCGLLIVSRQTADRKGWLAGWEYAVIGWTLLDLLVTGWTLNPGADPSFLAGSISTNERLSGLQGQTRIYLSAKLEDQLKFNRFLRFQDFSAKEDWKEMRSVLLPNLNLIDRVALLNNFDPLVPDSYFRWKQIVDRQSQAVQSGWLAWLGVGAVEQIDPTQPSGVRFDLLPGASRWHWYSCWQSFSNPDEIWKRIEEETSREIQEPRPVLMEGNKNGLVGNCSAASAPTVTWKTDLPGKMEIQVSTDQDGWLEIMDIWYPGWAASLDGKPIALEKADGTFMAVLVPSGSHQILLEYHPSGFIFINLLSILIVLFVIVLMTRLGRKRAERPSS